MVKGIMFTVIIFSILLVIPIGLCLDLYQLEDNAPPPYVKKPPSNITEKKIPPIPHIEIYPCDPKVGEKVVLDGSKSYDPDGKIVGYKWGYKLYGSSSLPKYIGGGEKIEYSWDKEGDYIVILEVKDNDGLISLEQKRLHVSKILSPPQPDFTYTPSDPVVGETITFDGRKSKDDGFIKEYMWEFDDGTIKYGKIVEHSFSSPGVYSVALIVKDDDGLKNATKKQIEVREMNEGDGSSGGRESNRDESPDSQHDNITDQESTQDNNLPNQEVSSDKTGSCVGKQDNNIDQDYTVESSEQNNNFTESYVNESMSNIKNEDNILEPPCPDADDGFPDKDDVFSDTRAADSNGNHHFNYLLIVLIVLINVLSICLFILPNRRKEMKRGKGYTAESRIEIIEITRI